MPNNNIVFVGSLHAEIHPPWAVAEILAWHFAACKGEEPSVPPPRCAPLGSRSQAALPAGEDRSWNCLEVLAANCSHFVLDPLQALGKRSSFSDSTKNRF